MSVKYIYHSWSISIGKYIFLSLFLLLVVSVLGLTSLLLQSIITLKCEESYLFFQFGPCNIFSFSWDHEISRVTRLPYFNIFQSVINTSWTADRPHMPYARIDNATIGIDHHLLLATTWNELHIDACLCGANECQAKWSPPKSKSEKAEDGLMQGLDFSHMSF